MLKCYDTLCMPVISLFKCFSKAVSDQRKKVQQNQNSTPKLSVAFCGLNHCHRREINSVNLLCETVILGLFIAITSRLSVSFLVAIQRRRKEWFVNNYRRPHTWFRLKRGSSTKLKRNTGVDRRFRGDLSWKHTRHFMRYEKLRIFQKGNQKRLDVK